MYLELELDELSRDQVGKQGLLMFNLDLVL